MPAQTGQQGIVFPEKLAFGPTFRGSKVNSKVITVDVSNVFMSFFFTF